VTARDVRLLLVPYDSARRATRMGAGPERLVEAGLATHLERAGHRVSCTMVELPDDEWHAEIGSAFELARRIARQVRAAQSARAFPVVVAGNCMASLGVVAGLGDDTGVRWLDAHGDFNTPETTAGGFLDGMALAALTGRCWTALCRGVPGFAPVPEEHVWLLGARDLDPPEAEALRRSRVRLVPPDDVGRALAEAPPDADGVRRLHVHLDLDVLDPRDARANGYAAPNGVRLPALLDGLRALGAGAGGAPVAALTLSAYDPAHDPDGRAAHAAIAATAALVGALPAPADE
jgi:arginase